MTFAKIMTALIQFSRYSSDKKKEIAILQPTSPRTYGNTLLLPS